VEQALALGYRHIDTAAAYNNEDAVGQALANSPTPREQIHVTSKVWWDQLQPDAMRHSMDRSLEALRSEYVDLFMLHWRGEFSTAPATQSRRRTGGAAVGDPGRVPRAEDRALIASLSKRERQVSPDFAPVWDAFDE
jgi:diketogulonate reductase-like aldo/keto reductase